MASHHYSSPHGTVHYVKKGLGDPVVLIHNVYPGADHHEFEHNVNELARHFTVYALDLLGFDQSDAPRLKYTAQTYVELIAGFLREEVGEPTAVVGAGLSCSYLTDIAAWRSELFTRLVFICPRSEPTGLDSPRWFAPLRHFFPTTPPLGAGYYETMAGDVELNLFLRDVFYHPKHVTPQLVARLRENANRRGAIHPYASLVTGYLDRRLLPPPAGRDADPARLGPPRQADARRAQCPPRRARPARPTRSDRKRRRLATLRAERRRQPPDRRIPQRPAPRLGSAGDATLRGALAADPRRI